MIDQGEPFLKTPRERRTLIVSYPKCVESLRLVEQVQAAFLTGDRSRLADVRVLKERHDQVEHIQ